MSFCPRCGKETEHQFCLDCMRELHPIVKKIGRVTAVLCPNCLKVQTSGGWHRKELQEIVERQVERAVSFNMGAHVEGVLLEPVAVEPGSQTIQMTVIGSVDNRGENYEEYYEVPIHIEGNRCTECEHMANTYFTGIVQLRNPNDEVAADIERLLGRNCTAIKDVTGGIDYYVDSHRVVQRVAREVHERFGGELKIRAQHFSYDNLASKNLYRVNASLRLPRFWRGSVISTGTKIMLIRTMGKLLKGIDLTNGRSLGAPCKNDYEQFATEQTTVVTDRPTLTILDPQTYQTVPVANAELASKEEATPGNTIQVVFINEQWYVVARI